MMKIIKFSDYSEHIRKYCDDNRLNYEKLKKAPKCFNHEQMIFQHVEPVTVFPYDDSIPSKVILEMHVDDGRVTFIQTEHTKKYLSTEY